ncbi:MAG TPA: phosphotransferase [Acidimicrobiales bacterium]|nr:phosphotransferase [Acidimicrobiales bacterium]
MTPSAHARLLRPWAGAWVDLIDGLEGARVLLLDHSPGRTGPLLADTASLLGVADADIGRAAVRRSVLDGCRAEVRVEAEDDLAGDGSRWDVVILDGTVGSGEPGAVRARVRRLVRALVPGGRLVVIADNPLSPLRVGDRLRRRPVGTTVTPLVGRLCRLLESEGLAIEQRFGLLPSSIAPVTCFDLEAPRAAAAVLQAASVRVEGGRAPALQALRQLAERRAAAGLVPAWMVIASPAYRRWEPQLTPPTARLGYADSREVKILRGEPPQELEKRYRSPAAAESEAMALQVLERAGVALAPRLLGRPADDGTCQSWLRGRPLCLSRLDQPQLTTWVGRAARVLGRLHRATQQPDGRVLVHGDYWLGNLLVEGDAVVGVVDWAGARWGAAGQDLGFLVDALVAAGRVAPSRASELAHLARREHAAGARDVERTPSGRLR